MAEPHVPEPALLAVAIFSRHAEAIAWAEEHLEQCFGKIALLSPFYAFNQTAYYRPSMGTELQKRFAVFRDLVDPEHLADIKLQTNRLEQELAAGGIYLEERPLNLDPGVLTLGKFMLATTKDQAHRIYLRGGIYAEVTLRFQDGAFEPWTWTYADYRQPEVRSFLKDARDFYRRRLRETDHAGEPA